MDSIPVVSFDGLLTAEQSRPLGSCPQVEQIHEAFSSVGYVFIKDHGIQKAVVSLFALESLGKVII